MPFPPVKLCPYVRRLTDKLALWAFGVLVASLLVSIGSAIWNGRTASRSLAIATEAKEQARNTALLENRKKAIEHLRQALGDVRSNHISSDTLKQIREAIDLSKLVFTPAIRSELDPVDAAASSDSVRRQKPDDGEMMKLRQLLESVISKMNAEAALA